MTEIEFLPLSSGSNGNAVLVRSSDGVLLVDAGLPRVELLKRLRAAQQRPDKIDAILLSHRHGDHARGAGPLSRRFDVPIYASELTLRHLKPATLKGYHHIHPGLEFAVAGFRVHPVRLAHDAPDTVAFLIEHGSVRIGIITDLGSSGGGLTQFFRGLDLLYLEFNHDRSMVQSGPYPLALRQRILGPLGHLSNDQAASLLKLLATPRLEHLYLAHLSVINNRPELARAAAAGALAELGLSHVVIKVAQRHTISSPSLLARIPAARTAVTRS